MEIIDALIEGNGEDATPGTAWNDFANFMQMGRDPVMLGSIAGHLAIAKLIAQKGGQLENTSDIFAYHWTTNDFRDSIEPPLTDEQQMLFGRGTTHALITELFCKPASKLR